MHIGQKGRGFPHTLRLLALAAGVAFLTAETCASDNLGKGSPGPVSFRISIAPDTVEANGQSDSGTISADGHFACFASFAKNLVSPTSPFQEIFVRDRWNDSIVNVSRLAKVFDPNTMADCQRPYLSPSGLFVVFESKGELTFDISSGSPENFPGVLNIFLKDLSGTNLQRVPSTELNADCTNASVSDDGRYVAFQTSASNIPGLSNPSGSERVYVYDVLLDAITLISHAMGAPSTICDRSATQPRVSANGAFVVFESFATNLTPEANPLAHFDNVPNRRIYVSAIDGTGMELVSRASGIAGAPADNHCTQASISADGRFVAFLYQGGTMVPGAAPSSNGGYIIRRDRDPGSLTSDLMGGSAFIFALFVSYGGAGGTGISDDGQFASYIGINAAQTDLQVSVGVLQGPVIAASRHVLAPGSTLDVFPDARLSGDGRWVVWTADTSEEVLGDTNAVSDVFGFGPIH
ncbi:MAG: hypothetical protein HY293_16915 [Planctomycetes bacterium]|nr:hypothetical protein [Planctomycetota bacterium]